MTAPPTPPAGGYPPQNPGYGAPASVRPGMLTGAAVLAFIAGGLGIIIGFLYLVGGALVSSLSASIAGVATLLGILWFVLAGLLIWGGVRAIGGKDTRILVIAGGLGVVATLIGAIILAFGVMDFITIVLGVLIVVLALNGQSKSWIASRGGTSF